MCPFCRTRQTRLALCGPELYIALMGLALLGIAVWVLASLVPSDQGVGGRAFARHRNDLEVTGATLNRTAGKRDFWLSGYVTNRGDHPWRIHRLEVRFVDGHGALLDVRHPEVDGPFVILPERDHAVRVSLGEITFTNLEAPLEVRVQRATDGDRPFQP